MSAKVPCKECGGQGIVSVGEGVYDTCSQCDGFGNSTDASCDGAAASSGNSVVPTPEEQGLHVQLAACKRLYEGERIGIGSALLSLSALINAVDRYLAARSTTEVLQNEV